MHAYREGVYLGVYDSAAGPLGPARVTRPEALAALLPAGKSAFVGEAVESHRALIASARPEAIFPERSLFLAAEIGRIAAVRLAAGEGATPDQLRPVYVREPHVGQARV
jgi:tRNA A37 threonylcarbamoyladenosine modification protein TsaB